MESNNSRKNSPYAVILGLNHYLGLQTARIFAKRGIPVIGITDWPKHFACRTNVCEKILFADLFSVEIVEFLIKMSQELEQKAVLIPCFDMTVLIISRHRQELEPYYHISLPEPDVVEMLMDKLSFYEYALKENLPIAKTYILHSDADAQEVAQKISFPAVLKPSLKTPVWEDQTNLKAYKTFNTEEFLKKYDECSRWAKILIAQEWLEGPDTNCYACNCYFNKNSEPIVTFVCKSIRKWRPETGNTSLGQECRNDTILNESIRLFKNLSFHGLAYLEMKLDERTGKYFIIEPNIGRPTGKSALAEACGVELLYTMYCDTIGWPLPQRIKQEYKGIKWIYWRYDLQSSYSYWARGELTLRDWLRSLRGRKTYALLSWSDPIPFFFDVFSSIISKSKTFVKKLSPNSMPSPSPLGNKNLLKKTLHL